MIAEATLRKEGPIRGHARVGYAISLLHRAPQIGNRPRLPIRRGGVRAKGTAGRGGVQALAQIGELGGGEHGPIATHAMITQRINARLPIQRTPLQEAGAATAGDRLDVGHRIAQAVQPHRLTTGAKGTIFRLEFGGLEGCRSSLG